METQIVAGMRNRPDSCTNVTKPKGTCKHCVHLSFHLSAIQEGEGLANWGAVQMLWLSFFPSCSTLSSLKNSNL